MQALHDLIDDLQRQRDVIDRRLGLAAELLNTYDPTSPDVVVPVVDEPAADPEPKKPAVKGKSRRVPCPDCGELFFAQGMGVHRSRKHTKPIRLVEASRDPQDTFGDDVYCCTSCSHEEPNEAGIRQHPMRVHNRAATDTERAAS